MKTKKKNGDDLRGFSVRIPREVRMALRQRAAAEERNLESIAADAFLDYLAKPLPRAQRAAS